MADVFVSYVREDRDIAEKLASGLTAAGFSVWWDRHIRGGVEFAKEIERELDAARAVIVLWSGDSLGSRWVRDEAEQAREEDKLIPVRLDGVQPPLGFRQTQALDFTGWKGDPDAATFTGLVDSVRHFIGGAASSSPRRVHAIDRSHGAAASGGRGSDGSSPRWQLRPSRPVQQRCGSSVPSWIGAIRRPVAAGGIEIGTFEPLTKSDELERFAKGMTATLVRVLATSGIKTVAPDQADAVSGKADAEFAAAWTRRSGRRRPGRQRRHRQSPRRGSCCGRSRRNGTQRSSRSCRSSSSVAVAAMLRCGLRLRARANAIRRRNCSRSTYDSVGRLATVSGSRHRN